MLRDWLDRAVPALEAARERIDAVNVFPVPDGDTGTNVLLTLRGAADEVAALPAGADGATDDGAAVLRALARGALLSARGNSGVILSRYLGGLAGAAPEAAPAAASGPALGAAPGALPDALAAAAAAARSAVPEPEDGTVLTVAAVVADAARHAAARGAGDAAALDAGVAAGRADLARISAAHPVLRSARVVDAGACALLVLLDALAAALADRPAPVDVGWLDEHGAAREPGGSADPTGAGSGDGGAGGYEVVALLRAGAGDGAGPAADATAAERVARDLAATLPAVGGAVAVVAGEGLVTAHVHAPAPADVATVLTAAGARWTASVRTLLGAERPVVACTGSGEAAAALAHAGAVAVLLPDGTPAEDARDAVRRAVQDAQQPVHAAGARGAAPAGDDPTTGAGRQGSVTVLPGDRLAAADLDPGWLVPAGATDEAGVLAALARLVEPGPASAGPVAAPASAGPPAPTTTTPAPPPPTPTTPTEARP